MGSPALTVERLVWMVAIVASYGGGNLLLNLPECEIGNVCSYEEMFDWKLGLGLIVLALFSIILGAQAIIARNTNNRTWISIFIDDRLMEQVIEEATTEDDVSTISDGWAHLEEKHLTHRLEEE